MTTESVLLCLSHIYLYLYPPPPPPSHVQVTILCCPISTTIAAITTAQVTMHALSMRATAFEKRQTMHHCKLLWAWPSTSTLQTTTRAREYMHSMVEDKAHQHSYIQRVRACLATVGVHNAASLHKGMPFNFCPYAQLNTTSENCKGQNARCKGQDTSYKGQGQHQC